MLTKWNQPRRWIAAIGVILASWAALQTDSVASGEFVLTDRIGEGSVFMASHRILPEMDGRTLYFQNGSPLNLTQLKTDQPYCKFISHERKLGEQWRASGKLVVVFKNVARTRWFLSHGVELECTGSDPRRPIDETEFQKALGGYFHVEKHTRSHSHFPEWNPESSI